MISSSRLNAETRNMVKALNSEVMTPKLYRVNKEEKKIYMEYLKEYVTLKSHLGSIKDNFA